MLCCAVAISLQTGNRSERALGRLRCSGSETGLSGQRCLSRDGAARGHLGGNAGAARTDVARLAYFTRVYRKACTRDLYHRRR